MSVIYSFNKGCCRLECAGEYSEEDVKYAFVTALDDPECPDTPKFVLDVTRSEMLSQRPTKDLIEIAQFMVFHANEHQIERKRCAIIASEDLHFGLMRMMSIYGKSYGVETEVFRDEKKANEWLFCPSSS